MDLDQNDHKQSKPAAGRKIVKVARKTDKGKEIQTEADNMKHKNTALIKGTIYIYSKYLWLFSNFKEIR